MMTHGIHAQLQTKNRYLFNGLFPGTTWICQFQKSKTILDYNEARGDGFRDGSGIGWTTSKQSEACSRQITTPKHPIAIFLWTELILFHLESTEKIQVMDTAGSDTYRLHSNYNALDYTIRYDMRCYFNMHSKANMSQLNLPHRNNN